MAPYSVGIVYFFKPVGMDGPIKIGFTKDPAARLRSVNSWVPWKLEMVASIPGTLKMELRLHALLQAYRMRGEWFAGSPEVLAVVDAINAGTLDVGSLPPAKRPASYYSDEVRARWAETRALKVRYGPLRDTMPDSLRHQYSRLGYLCGADRESALAALAAFAGEA